jgi:type I restriction enzyme S subunit
MNTFTLGELAVMKYGKLPPKEIFDSGCPIFTGYRVSGYAAEYLYENSMLVVVARGVGGTGDVKLSPPRSWITNLSIVLDLDDRKADKQFMCYFLGQQSLKEKLNTGSAQAQITVNALSTYQVTIPCLLVQRRIASILSAYDDLIENNTRRIAILEEMARRIYEEWFVRFRFPGHEGVRMVESELGLVPEGWEWTDVARAVQRFGTGQKYDLKTVMSSGQIPVLDQGRQGIIGYHNNEPGFIASFADPVVVFANHTCYQRLIFEPFSTIQNVIPYKSSAQFQRDVYWIYHATLGLVGLTEYKGHWPQFEAKKILVPTASVAREFGKFVRPIHQLAHTLVRTSNNLRTTRDQLLPKLISGELDVSRLPEPEPAET